MSFPWLRYILVGKGRVKWAGYFARCSVIGYLHHIVFNSMTSDASKTYGKSNYLFENPLRKYEKRCLPISCCASFIQEGIEACSIPDPRSPDRVVAEEQFITVCARKYRYPEDFAETGLIKSVIKVLDAGRICINTDQVNGLS
ncbi:MAG: hypothetical protein HGA77_09875 [Chlorobiaceae bacterium]|nr:hypothetical protein [Chlorobiaceae bacterium]